MPVSPLLDCDIHLAETASSRGRRPAAGTNRAALPSGPERAVVLGGETGLRRGGGRDLLPGRVEPGPVR
jgi:hypothetical protein